MEGDPSPDDLTRPATDADVRRSYLDAAVVGYAVNGVGAATAFIAAALVLADSQAGMHSLALATGLISAALVT